MIKRMTFKATLLLMAVLSCLPTGLRAQIQRPRLVVGLVVDQMRWDYLYYYYNQYGEGGLRRLVDGGYSFENTHINYVPTITAVGHAAIYTGTVPAFNGIVGNNFFIKGKSVYCCEDKSVQTVGSQSTEGQMSPRNLEANTIGDMLKLATDFKAKVIGVALKDRAAILPAGHSADAAYWWDTSAGHYISSTYYMNELPQWVQQFNKEHKTKPGFNIKMSPDGVSKTFEMATAALENEALGQDDITDLLAVSISSTDAISHEYGTRSDENKAAFMQLDKDLTRFLDVLDKKVGRGNYLLFLTADHGGAHNPNYLKSHKIPSGGLASWEWPKKLNQQLGEQFGAGSNFVRGINSGKVYLDHEAITKAGLQVADVKQAVIRLLRQDSRLQYVVAYDQVLTESIPAPLRERIVNGYNRERSGDIYFAPRPGIIDASDAADYRGTNHSQWNPFDAHIPFVLYGWNVSHGRSNREAHIVDIVPTVCSMLHIQMPNACTGTSLEADR